MALIAIVSAPEPLQIEMPSRKSPVPPKVIVPGARPAIAIPPAASAIVTLPSPALAISSVTISVWRPAPKSRLSAPSTSSSWPRR